MNSFTLKPSIPLLLKNSASLKTIPISLFSISKKNSRNDEIYEKCANLSWPTFVSRKETEFETEEEYHSTEESQGQALKFVENGVPPGNRQRERRRYRKQYPGEVKGITEEMRFVTMKLRTGGKRSSKDDSAGSEADELGIQGKPGEGLQNNGASWEPSMEGFLKYLVDSKLVFNTIEHIVDESSDVSCKFLIFSNFLHLFYVYLCFVIIIFLLSSIYVSFASFCTDDHVFHFLILPLSLFKYDLGIPFFCTAEILKNLFDIQIILCTRIVY